MKFAFFLVTVVVLCLFSLSTARATASGHHLSATMKKHYATLTADESDDLHTIKQKHRKLALKYHPDRNTPRHSSSSETKMQEINHAFDSVTIFLSGGGEPSAEFQDIMNILRTWWEKIPQKERDSFGAKLSAYFQSEHRQADMSILFGVAYEKFMQVQSVVILLAIILVFLLTLGSFALFVIIFRLIRFVIRIIFRIINFFVWLISSLVGSGSASSSHERGGEKKKTK